MKHLLNDLSNEEKNRIREQYEGGMTVDPSRFRNLMESKLGDIKPLIKESTTDESMKDDRFVSCSQLGVKYPGKCERKTKKPVESCSKFGVKTVGYCYVDTKKPVPNK